MLKNQYQYQNQPQKAQEQEQEQEQAHQLPSLYATLLYGRKQTCAYNPNHPPHTQHYSMKGFYNAGIYQSHVDDRNTHTNQDDACYGLL